MRVTGGHELGEKAVTVVRQAVSLAAWRGHAQVTPLHIARAMLSAPAPASILRAACVRPYPLQPNALDLRLDLALGRLAVTHHGGDPAPSNAFVATLKRAQAHPYRRTGGARGKVELEKLAVSVLDDPGVHRVVVRAAGFSSSQVRTSVDASSEQSSSAGRDVAASSPNPFPDMIRAGRGQPSLPDGRRQEREVASNTALAVMLNLDSDHLKCNCLKHVQMYFTGKANLHVIRSQLKLKQTGPKRSMITQV